MSTILFGDKMLIVFIRSIILYIVIVFALRLMGKRQLGELQPSELVITILVSNVATLPIEDLNIPMAMGIVPILTLVSLDVVMSIVTIKSRLMRKFVSGSPKIIINNGKLDQNMLEKLRYTADDLFESMRGENIFNIDDIQFAIVETTGKINYFLKTTKSPPDADTLKIKVKNKNPPLTIIENGKLIKDNLEIIKKGRGWLYGILQDNNADITDVFLLSADDTGAFTFIRKEKQ